MMHNRLMRFIVLCALAALLLAGCAGEGGSDDQFSVEIPIPSEAPPEFSNIADLADVYRLVDFTVAFSDGNTVTSDDVSSFSGRFTLTPHVSTQRITVNGRTVRIETRLTLLENESILVTNMVSGCQTILSFSLVDGLLTTFLSLEESRKCGGNFSETDVWESLSGLSEELKKIDRVGK